MDNLLQQKCKYVKDIHYSVIDLIEIEEYEQEFHHLINIEHGKRIQMVESSIPYEMYKLLKSPNFNLSSVLTSKKKKKRILQIEGFFDENMDVKY